MSPPANQRAVRRHNLGVVLRHVSDRGSRSRATIAHETGLNKSTVSSLVSELIDLGLLEERGMEHTGMVGRPGLVVDVAGDGGAGIGLEVGPDSLAVHATDLAGAERHAAAESGSNRGADPGRVLDRLAALARDALSDLRAQAVAPLGITVGLPGLVDSRAGVLVLAPELGWEDVAVARELAERIDWPRLPIAVDSAANLAALAELREGAGRGLADFVHVSGDMAIGAGVVLGGELLRGAHGFGGELGHVTVEPDGALCACGARGCLETRAGLAALLAAAGEGPDDAAGSATERVARLGDRAARGDDAATGALTEGGRWLGIALASTANLLDPEAFVLGGFLAPLAGHMTPAAGVEVRGRMLAARRARPEIVASRLGPHAASRGGAAAALLRVLDDPGLAGAAVRREVPV